VPYLLVGAQPSFDDWQSRHQLLMPLGTSFILYYGSKIFLSRLNISRSALYVVVAFLALTFIMTNFLQQVEYTKDWFKQVSLMGNLKRSNIIQEHTTFFFDDNVPQYNANGRTYRFYEYAGFMKKVFHDQTRFGISRQEFRNFGSMDALTPYFNAQYNLKDYKPATFAYTISINPGPRTLTWNEYLRLSYYSLFHIEKFQEYSKALTNLESSKN
jgi:hypothetical protein